MVKPGCGALQDTSGAVDTFLKTCVIQRWTPGFNGWNPLTSWCGTLCREKFLDPSITSYADDVAKSKLFKDGQELRQLVLAEGMALSDSHQRICTAQHTGKQEHTVSMRGRGSWDDVQRICTAGFFDRSSSHEHQMFGELASS